MELVDSILGRLRRGDTSTEPAGNELAQATAFELLVRAAAAPITAAARSLVAYEQDLGTKERLLVEHAAAAEACRAEIVDPAIAALKEASDRASQLGTERARIEREHEAASQDRRAKDLALDAARREYQQFEQPPRVHLQQQIADAKRKVADARQELGRLGVDEATARQIAQLESAPGGA